ncbi:MAG: cation transporter [Candidatus Zixiibacteriota bacterium]|nr:MAG: cation transporter [candidate division Zixibacteria bacterium]
MSHTHSHSSISGKKLFWAIIFNSIITIAEFIGGILTGYLALLADAVHNLSDVAALGLAWIGVKGSQIPASKKSTYGFKRIEVITAFISAVSLVVIAIFILMEAYERYINPQEITNPALFITVATIGLVGNILSILFLHSEKGKSLNMKTAFLHMAYDAISSIVVIIGGIVITMTGLVIIDTILSSFIALMIFWSSYLVIKEAVLIFMESAPEGINFDDIYDEIMKFDIVEEIHDLHIWSLSSTEIALSCHICISKDDISQGQIVITKINQIIKDKFNIGHSTIQLEHYPDSTEKMQCNIECKQAFKEKNVR